MPSDRRTLFDLARAMIKQAKMLRDAGMIADARALARRAIAADAAAWQAARLQPIPIRVGRR